MMRLTSFVPTWTGGYKIERVTKEDGALVAQCHLRRQKMLRRLYACQIIALAGQHLRRRRPVRRIKRVK
jgi:hypothetical protein